MGNSYAFNKDFLPNAVIGQTGDIGTGVKFNPEQDPPLDWVIYISYRDFRRLSFSILMGIQAQLNGLVSGCGPFPFLSLWSEKIVPLVGGAYMVSGRSVQVDLTPFSGTANAYGMNVQGVPNGNLNPDHEAIPTPFGLPLAAIPEWSVGVSASPPNQTIEVLGVDQATVVQTLVLTDYMNYAPLHPLGVYVRNTALVDTLFSFKKKNFFG